MNRRGFLATLLGAAAAVAAKPLAAFAPAPDALVALPLSDAPAVVLVDTLTLIDFRKMAREALGRWMAQEMDRMFFEALTGADCGRSTARL